ncbi:MAG: T9SS type A sorting domain-containing protein [Bacteroidota bacterium]|nr:T9SS type A sorting domain-containing protein [Bacteroidota bacterium]MDP4235521.1 T9SS type A sorting domain-containing protein [Bacteroidota bacterium]
MKTSILRGTIRLFAVALCLSLAGQASARHQSHSDASTYRLVKIDYTPISGLSSFGISNVGSSTFMGILRIPITPLAGIPLLDGGHDGDHGKNHKDSSGGHHGKDSTDGDHGRDSSGGHHDGGKDTTANHHDGDNDTTGNRHSSDNDSTGDHHGQGDTTMNHHDGDNDTTGHHGSGDNDSTGDHHGQSDTTAHHDGDNDTTGHHRGGDNDSTGDVHGHHDGDSTDVGDIDTVENHGHADNDSTDVTDTTDHILFGSGTQRVFVRSHSGQTAISFRFTNNSTVPVTISGASFTIGTNFLLQGNVPTAVNPVTLSSGASMKIQIVFRSADHAVHNDQLIIRSSSAQTSSTISLQGIQLAAAKVSGNLPSGVSITAMPNPMTSLLKVTASGVRNVSVVIYDMLGKSVLSADINSAEWIWNGSASDGSMLLSGTYLVRISGISSEGEPFVTTQKIILQR